VLTDSDLRSRKLDGEVQDPDGSPDFSNGIGSKVVRCRFDGCRAVAVGADTPTTVQINALLDLLDLHLHTQPDHADIPVSTDEVAVLLGGRYKGRSEAVDALGTLVRAMRTGPRVRLLEHTEAWRPVGDAAVDFRTPHLYPRYARLLDAVPTAPPALVIDLLAAVGQPALRAYPMLSSHGRSWSLRLEGLQVGVLHASRGWLGVGKQDSPGPAPQTWRTSTGLASTFLFRKAEGVREAATHISRFADSWLAEPANAPGLWTCQDEHALESRILRGAVTLEAEGRTLQRLRQDGVVNWGSQFPTKWGRDGKARYLDGLLRDGSIPWAVEMKVEGGAGVGQYYRHAVTQAVLYREFIRSAEPLHDWFARQGLDAAACRAAVVVPVMVGTARTWLGRLQALCRMFDVTLIQVPAGDVQVTHRRSLGSVMNAA
jgi:hypothetical protein